MDLRFALHLLLGLFFGKFRGVVGNFPRDGLLLLPHDSLQLIDAIQDRQPQKQEAEGTA